MADFELNPITGELDKVQGIDPLEVKGIQFDTANPTDPIAEGLLRWNDTDGTLDLGMDGGNVTMQIGQEMFTKVRNPAGGDPISNGQVVYISGRTGVFPDVSLARSDSEATSRALGVATQDITAPDFGFITTTGYVRGIKTDYTGTGIWGTTWATGDLLWVSKTNAGVLTNVEPDEPHHSDLVASVGIISSNQGSILVNINRHRTLEELTDVNGTALTTTGQFPAWDNTAGYFDFNYNINDYALTSDLTSYFHKTNDDTADLIEATDKKFVTDADLVNLGNLSGTNTGDQDLSHTGEVTGTTNALTVDKTAITGKSAVTAVDTDYVLISDTSDSGNLKKALKSDFGSVSLWDRTGTILSPANTTDYIELESTLTDNQTNGDFATGDFTGWTKNTGAWTISGGWAIWNDASSYYEDNLRSTFTPVIGTAYKVSFDWEITDSSYYYLLDVMFGGETLLDLEYGSGDSSGSVSQTLIALKTEKFDVHTYDYSYGGLTFKITNVKIEEVANDGFAFSNLFETKYKNGEIESDVLNLNVNSIYYAGTFGFDLIPNGIQTIGNTSNKWN